MQKIEATTQITSIKNSARSFVTVYLPQQSSNNGTIQVLVHYTLNGETQTKEYNCTRKLTGLNSVEPSLGAGGSETFDALDEVFELNLYYNGVPLHQVLYQDTPLGTFSLDSNKLVRNLTTGIAVVDSNFTAVTKPNSATVNKGITTKQKTNSVPDQKDELTALKTRLTDSI